MISSIFLSVRDKATRLPNKVMREVEGKPLVVHLIERLQTACVPDMLVMTTSTHPDDARLAEVAAECGIECFRGSEEDKLQRYLDAAIHYGVGIAAVVDGDDIFCDPPHIDRVIDTLTDTDADYVTCEGLPVGGTSFGIRIAALKKVCELKAESDTEIWGEYFTRGGRFDARVLSVDNQYRHPEWRMTLDYPEDLAFFEAVFAALYRPGSVFGLDEIVQFLLSHPEVAAMNQCVQRLYEEGIRTATPVRFKGPVGDGEVRTQCEV